MDVPRPGRVRAAWTPELVASPRAATAKRSTSGESFFIRRDPKRDGTAAKFTTTLWARRVSEGRTRRAREPSASSPAGAPRAQEHQIADNCGARVHTRPHAGSPEDAAVAHVSQRVAPSRRSLEVNTTSLATVPQPKVGEGESPLPQPCVPSPRRVRRGGLARLDGSTSVTSWWSIALPHPQRSTTGTNSRPSA